MQSAADTHVESARIRQEIEDHLGLESKDLDFEFGNKDGNVKLDLITINPRHNQSFLFHSVLAVNKVEAMKSMLTYVQSYKEKESSYTIQWTSKGSSELHTSYFRAKNIADALDKLYYGRDMNTLTVFSVVLNPVT